MAARLQDPGDLAGSWPPVDLHGEIEEAIWIRQRTGPAHLEDDTPLGVEPDPGAGLAHELRASVDATHAGGRELPSEEQRRLAVAAVEDDGAFGGWDVQQGGGQRGEEGDGHGAMISTIARGLIL